MLFTPGRRDCSVTFVRERSPRALPAAEHQLSPAPRPKHQCLQQLQFPGAVCMGTLTCISPLTGDLSRDNPADKACLQLNPPLPAEAESSYCQQKQQEAAESSALKEEGNGIKFNSFCLRAPSKQTSCPSPSLHTSEKTARFLSSLPA